MSCRIAVLSVTAFVLAAAGFSVADDEAHTPSTAVHRADGATPDGAPALRNEIPAAAVAAPAAAGIADVTRKAKSFGAGPQSQK